MTEAPLSPQAEYVSGQDIDVILPVIRPRLLRTARSYLQALDKRIAAPINDIAEDVVQKALSRTVEAFRSKQVGEAQIDSLEGYLRQAVKRQCLDYARAEKVRRESFAGGSVDMAEFDDREVNRDQYEWVSPVVATPESLLAAKQNPPTEALWRYAMDNQNTYTGGAGFERVKGMSEEAFLRGIEIVRCYAHGLEAPEIAQRLQNLELISQEYDLSRPADSRRASNLIYKIYQRMMERLGASIARDGFLLSLLEELA